jgi:hypothetical protein
MLGMMAAAGQGAWAGWRATVPMTVVMKGAQSIGLLGEAPPRKITRRVLRAFGVGTNMDDAKTQAVTTLAHLGFGAGMGALYAVLRKAGVVPRHPLSGAAFGALVWASSYVGWVPKLGIMPPPEKDRPLRPQVMLLAHLVYGVSLERHLS